MFCARKHIADPKRTIPTIVKFSRIRNRSVTISDFQITIGSKWQELRR